jgi:hypothetical protein
MKIDRAYTTITLEAAVGAYDTKEFRIVSNENELEVAFFPDYVFVTERINWEHHSDEFPRKNWDKKLWKLIWARFRAHCGEEEELEEISAEDYAEWAAASCGMTYNEYIGKPWLD